MRFIVFMVCLLYARTTFAIQCPTNWTRLESSCVLHVEEHGRVNYNDSRENCRKLGADLISVRTARKAEAVLHWLNKNSSNPLINVDVWLGNRVDDPDFNVSEWELEVGRGHWLKDEYASPLDSDLKMCLVFRLTFRDLNNVKWNTKKCMFGQASICEINSSQMLTINTTFLFSLMLMVAIFTNKQQLL